MEQPPAPPSPTRRRFLASAAAAGVTAWAAPSQARRLDANNRVRCGAIGVGNRGSALLQAVLEREDVEIVAIADTYDVWRDRAIQWCRDKGQKPKGYVRFEEMLDRARLDGVVIATPDHVHAPAALAALDAGLDVYCEKPITLTTEKAAVLRDKVHETGAVFQTGTQLRSEPMYQKARELVQSGAIGKLAMVCVNRHFQWEPRAVPWPPEANDENVHWEEFLRETERYPLDLRRYFHWRDFIDYSNGFTGDLMVHHLDICHFITGCAMPSRVVSAGGIYFVKDGRTCPDTVSTLAEYPEEFQFSFSATAANGYCGLVERYLGSEGTIEIRDMAAMTVHRRDVKEDVGSDGLKDAPHLANFFDCMRSRAETIAPVDAGFNAATVAHMAVMSQRTGTAAKWQGGRLSEE